MDYNEEIILSDQTLEHSCLLSAFQSKSHALLTTALLRHEDIRPYFQKCLQLS